jgi:putative FmdB family regulatory protein
MPIYEYDCPRCGSFEVSQKITAEPLTQHDCGSPVQRRISATSFALKGGGWYSDGYASSRSSGSSSSSSCTPAGCDKPACGAKSEGASA